MKTDKIVANAMKSGFTLIELLVVVGILGILATIGIVNFAGKTDQAEIVACQSSVRAIEEACSMYKLDHQQYPKTMTDLVTERNDKPAAYKGSPEDPWHNEYKIEVKKTGVIVTSAGPNGQFGDEDDISSKVMTKKSN